VLSAFLILSESRVVARISVQQNFQDIVTSFQTNWPETVKLSGAFEKCSVIISAGALGILNKDAFGFSQYIKANCRLEPLNTLQQPPAPFEFLLSSQPTIRSFKICDNECHKIK
jgi:hypothetical protein